ncbi:amidohydrolase [Variovorax humicola]|uniref:Amidohydrolase n=1 Tax=Variovorax humicola TaxID=1769758 RepID=A0ABU8VTA9_9BURK
MALFSAPTTAQGLTAEQVQDLGRRADTLLPKMVAWRRDIHQHPELSGQEVRTSKLVADHLRALGLEVRTGVGGHGVVGLLKGDLPGKVVALRADMDALPVREITGLPFASGVTARNFGQVSPVMHACGHDGHVAILMGAAEILAGMRSQLRGSVKFIFQPAEEGRSEEPADPNAPFGARAMVADGALQNPKVDAIFGLHITPSLPTGTIAYRSGPALAGADGFRIKVTGRQTHGAQPWAGVDPIVASAQIVTGLRRSSAGSSRSSRSLPCSASVPSMAATGKILFRTASKCSARCAPLTPPCAPTRRSALLPLPNRLPRPAVQKPR